MNLKIEYTNPLLTKIEQGSYQNNKWYELRASKDTKLREGDFATISLGIKAQIPENYEMQIIAKRNLFKKYGLILTSGIEIIDSSVTEEITINVYATKDTKVNFNDRICQFKMCPIQEQINFI